MMKRGNMNTLKKMSKIYSVNLFILVLLASAAESKLKGFEIVWKSFTFANIFFGYCMLAATIKNKTKGLK